MFDSGVGGLSVYREFRRLAPSERVIYFADTAYFPYGPRSAAEVRKRAFAITQRLLEADVKLIVVACNTASAAAVTDLREAFPVPFVGMVPGVKPAASLSKSRRVAILATSGTLDGGLFNKVVDEFGRGATIRAVHDDTLAPIVERGLAGSPQARTAVRAALEPEIRAGADTVVLGCTHFNFLDADILAEFPGVALVDTSEPVARRVAAVLAERGLQASPGATGTLDVIVSGDHAHFHALCEQLGVLRPTEVAQ
jgi:glutamate racemase